MSYYRYTRLQQYINGQPTDTYTKGERADNVDYSTYGTCMGSSAVTQWVSIPQTICYNGDLWSMEKEQISYDNRISWVDTGNTRRASVIEQSSSQCFMSEWRVVPGEYICMMYAKWPKEAEYLSYDGGQTWTATGNIRRGETVIELLSADCGVIYQWIPTGEYICQGYNKYAKEKQVYSTDNGSTWTDTGNRRTGGLVEADSPYCGYEQYIYQWVDVSGEYICQNYDKYTKQKEQRSSDNGQTWVDTGNTRAGEYIESLSTDCGVTYRWITVPNDYVCAGYDKYSKEKQQYSTDGTTWVDTGNTRAGSTLIEQNSEDCGYVPSPYSTEYLTTEALGNGYIRLSKHTGSGYGSKVPLTNIQYSKNDGAWTAYTYNTNISVVTGDKVRWKATLNDGNSTDYYSSFVSTADYKVYGNPLSLLDNDNFVNEPDAIYDSAYRFLFYDEDDRKTLKDVSDLALPATTLAKSCYSYMFRHCESLTTAPALPATTLATGCYYGMFQSCSLTTAPSLPATTLADDCYHYMFASCIYLTTAPVLPARTLADDCYNDMFSGCRSLTTAPELPATTLADGCYDSMFWGCTSLTTAPALPATTLAVACYQHMFTDCSSLTTAPALPATTLTYWCYYSMFNGCTSLTTAPELPATTLVDDCYWSMFYGCTSLNYIKCLATDISAIRCTYYWTHGVSSSGTFVKESSMTDWTTGDDGIPSGWTVQNV